MAEEHICNHPQCRLSIETATTLNDFIEQSKRDREACELRYRDDKEESQAFRKEIIEKIDSLGRMIGGVVPSVETGRKIIWSVAALAAASIISGFFLGVWRLIKLLAKEI